MDGTRKKTAAAIHQEVAAEVNTLLSVIFTADHKDRPFDFEAVESLTRATLLRAGSTCYQKLSGMRRVQQRRLVSVVTPWLLMISVPSRS